jgi:gamma-glutamyl-gamma-aminobutyrate hydrolase PuuD
MGAAPSIGRPVIGITAYEEDASWGVREQERAALLPATYVASVESAGGVPVVLPVQAGAADALVARLDGVVLAGGPDVDPSRYGADRHPRTDPPREARDGFELAVLEAAVRRGIPVLAICRGLQALNVARGGTLHQHLGDFEAVEHHGAGGVYAQRLVKVDPASKLASLLGSDQAAASCHHHQAVDDIGEGLVPVAWADDGTVEALEDPTLPFLVGVQWHPEVGADGSLFRGLVEAAVSPAR